jgi:NMD protein affecting ribosome stability and mRNA decay
MESRKRKYDGTFEEDQNQKTELKRQSKETSRMRLTRRIIQLRSQMMILMGGVKEYWLYRFREEYY